MKRTLYRMLICLALCLALGAQALAADAGTPVSMRNADGTITRGVQVKALGSVLTVVKSGSGEITVPSSWLIWDRTAPLDRHFAYIYYTKKTTVNMRLTEKPKSAIVGKAKVGRIVMVADVGEDHSKVIYGSSTGYLPNSVLRFLNPAEAEPQHALVSYQGQTTGKHKVNLRQSASKGSKALQSLTPGTAAVVLRHENGWYEVEVDGWHGYIQEAFLTVGGPVELTGPGAEPAGPELTGEEPAAEEDPAEEEGPAEEAVPDEDAILNAVPEEEEEGEDTWEDEDPVVMPQPNQTMPQPLDDDLFEPLS